MSEMRHLEVDFVLEDEVYISMLTSIEIILSLCVLTL
jgi:hypothetical protein